MARELSRRGPDGRRGILEPLQTADSLDGQVEELRAVLEERAALPVVVIGWSWGAMLGLILAARHPALVSKLVMVSSGALEQRVPLRILETRLARLSDEARQEALALMGALEDPARADADSLLGRLGAIFEVADAYDPVTLETEVIEVSAHVNQAVWREAAALRLSGGFVEAARRVACPIVALHGDHDPHPAEAVRAPLEAAAADVRFIALERCGHAPWRERWARARFFELLEAELGGASGPF